MIYSQCNPGGAIISNKSKTTTNQNIKPCILNAPPKQFSILSSVIGLALIDGLDIDQQNALGNFLVNVGQNILTAAAQGQVTANIKQDNDTAVQIENLKCQLNQLEEQINKKGCPQPYDV